MPVFSVSHNGRAGNCGSLPPQKTYSEPFDGMFFLKLVVVLFNRFPYFQQQTHRRVLRQTVFAPLIAGKTTNNKQQTTSEEQMKFNKWTLGLAAVGAVSMASAVRAEETPTLSPVETALSSTTISGYVSASANWQISPSGNNTYNSIANAIPYLGGQPDGFNLDVVKLSISKPQDESPWASGYQVDLLFGPDAVGYNPSANANHVTDNNGTGYTYNNSGSDFAIKQAYIALRTPIGNGIDWKIGVFDTIIGYETFDAG